MEFLVLGGHGARPNSESQGRWNAGSAPFFFFFFVLQVQVWAHVCSPYRVEKVLEEGGQRLMALHTCGMCSRAVPGHRGTEDTDVNI